MCCSPAERRTSETSPPIVMCKMRDTHTYGVSIFLRRLTAASQFFFASRRIFLRPRRVPAGTRQSAESTWYLLELQKPKVGLMVFLSPPNSNGLAVSTFQARTNPPLTRALAAPSDSLLGWHAIDNLTVLECAVNPNATLFDVPHACIAGYAHAQPQVDVLSRTIHPCDIRVSILGKLHHKRRYRHKGCPSKDQLCCSCIWSTIKVLFFQSRHVKRDAKRAVYKRLILSICLYGCESWCLKETLYTDLRQFHARCVRTMSRTNLHHTWTHRISTKNLEKELGLDSMNTYIARRQLRWLGHVSRMPFDRLPRRMLSSWFPAPRCTGATKMTYGRTMKKAMATFDINPQNWYELAADREKWHAMIK